jgi:hypothetical protein
LSRARLILPTLLGTPLIGRLGLAAAFVVFALLGEVLLIRVRRTRLLRVALLIAAGLSALLLLLGTAIPILIAFSFLIAILFHGFFPLSPAFRHSAAGAETLSASNAGRLPTKRLIH